MRRTDLRSRLSGQWGGRGPLALWLLGGGLLSLLLGLAALAWTQTHTRQASESASREWAQSLARAAAHASTHALITRDLGGLDLALADLAALPGVLHIEVQDSRGQPLLRLTQTPAGLDALRIDHRPQDRLFDPRTPAGVQRGIALGRDAVVAWEPVSSGLPLGYAGVAHAPDAALPIVQGQALMPWWALVAGLTLLVAGGAWGLRRGAHPPPAGTADAGLSDTRSRLAERSARFNAVVDLSPDGIALFDGHGQLVFVNPALGEMIGWAEAIVWQDLSMAAFDRHFASLSAQGRGFAPLGAGLQSDEPDILEIERPRRRVLARRWRRNPAGAHETVFYFRDITHETEVDRMKSEFLNSAAHELRTPLASIYGFSELMLRRPMEAERQRELLGTVHQQADRLSRIINELLDIARIEARQGLDFAIHPIALGPLVRDTLASLVMPQDDRPVQVELHHDGELLQADADKTRQALLNLLTNAYKYSPGGGPIRLRSWRDNGGSTPMVAIAVEDEGMGMTPEQMTHLFERFWRADTSGHIPGTGLGLSLVKEIVELQQGRVDVQSVWQRGTTVTVWLPAAPVEAATDRTGPA